MTPAPLSTYPTSQTWLSQFSRSDADRATAAALLDAMLLLNEEQVSAAIRMQLYRFAEKRRGRRRRVALYGEREFAGRTFFMSELLPDREGRLRLRAVGRSGPLAVNPVRGSTRVGSEGMIASIIATVVESRPDVFMNNPGPDRIRGKTAPASSIVIVTDFIGSGTRVSKILDAMHAVPSVRAWRSFGLVDFHIIAAAGAAAGLERVRRHVLRPQVSAEHIAPTVGSRGWDQERAWSRLVGDYGPATGRGAGRWGFRASAALIGFNYRLPNNTPALLHQSEGGWRALFTGAAPPDLRPAFGLRTDEDALEAASEATGVALAPGLAATDGVTVLLLSLMRGRWRRGKELVLAERTGLPAPTVLETLRRAVRNGLLLSNGRLTDAGHALLKAGRRGERRRPDIPTNPDPYYPQNLRAPRPSSSIRRSSERP